ncbi:MAG: M1 family metallopeptidase [Methanomicrobiaceae archaeon]|nr:M1 family metallopeptidase [Methanomicrobiaceae archaeon]
MSPKRLFKYYPEDFGEPPVVVRHMDLTFDVFDDHTRVHSILSAETRETPLTTLQLNAKNLEIVSVESDTGAVSYEYDTDAHLLSVVFSHPVPPRTSFSVETRTVCRPSSHVLEGLYYDETPKGAPPQQITQCQQWGFQRLVPCLDDMTAKCTYTTTIIADERYTNLITNGDVAVPRHPVSGGRVAITYENLITPMAPYLFFLGVGTYATFSRPFEYPGGRKFTLELLVPPGSDPDAANRALDVLADAILWVHLYTGPEYHIGREIRDRIYALSRKRDTFIRDGVDAALPVLRASLARLMETITPGYTYTGTVYREIGMQNSDFGGMENVGNTTISTNRIMPFTQMTDPAFEYMVSVKVHEFYHNLNGSEVTGWSPFEIWLNEAVTVHIERMYHAFLFGEKYSRLQTVLTLLSPDGGTLSYDRGAGSLPIEPDGFNDPNELITGVTYVKAPEFVRMIETLIGSGRFAEGLDLYHRRYGHGNATRTQWIGAMEEVSGMDFTATSRTWLKQRGYPELHVTTDYDPGARTMTLRCVQQATIGDTIWEFPFAVACVDADGRDIAEQLAVIRKKETVIRFTDVPKPAFVSVNRGYSFYGIVRYEAPEDELYLQVRKDTDIVGRFLAFHRICDREKMRLLSNPGSAVSDSFADLFVELLSDDTLMATAGGYFLTIFESVEDEEFSHRYRDLYEVRLAILRAIAQRHTETLLDLSARYSGRVTDNPDISSRIADIKNRQIRNLCIGILATQDTPEIHRLLKKQFDTSPNATDRQVAFATYLTCTAPDRDAVFAAFLEESGHHPVAWEAFLSAVAGSGSSDALALIRRAEASPSFRIKQANDQRALYGRFARNRKISLQTEDGRQYLQDVLIRLARVNEYTTVNALSVFGDIDRMEPVYHVPLVGLLVSLLSTVDEQSAPSVYNTVRRLLIGAPDAVRRYEAESGRVITAIR